MVTVLKQAEENDDLVIRAYETSGASASATIPTAQVARVRSRRTSTLARSRPSASRATRQKPVRETNLLEWET